MSQRAFLFDLDGTLLDTAPDLYLAINALRAEFDRPPLTLDTALAMVGKGAHNLIKRALNYEAPFEFDLDEAYAHFAAHYHRVNGQSTTAYDGVEATLRALHLAGHPLAVVTNKPSEFTLPLLEQFGWHHLFGSIVCGDTLTLKKPNPEPLLHACAKLGVAPNQTLMVGDSMNDVWAAQRAGCACVVLDYGYNEGMPIRQALAEMKDIPIYSAFSSIIQWSEHTSEGNLILAENHAI